MQITIRDMPSCEALEAQIGRMAGKLFMLFTHLIACRVILEIAHKNHLRGEHFNVRICLDVPGNEIVVSLQHHMDLCVALRDAFVAARHQLEDYARRLQRETRVHCAEKYGHVVRIFHRQGFGIITSADGGLRYFDRDSVINLSFERLQPGNEVKFVDAMGAGELQAGRVSFSQHRFP
jgi:cold shock CspA family protein/ribosome-associated translation inhibitor RaiA